MIQGVLMVLMMLLAGAAVAGAYDPNPANNEADVLLQAFDPPTVTLNVSTGNGSSILDPSQNQTHDQASAQTQTFDNSDSNSLTNSNVNIASSTSSATNTITRSNNNSFDPVLVVFKENYIGKT